MSAKGSKKRIRALLQQHTKVEAKEPEVPATRRSDDGLDVNGEPLAKRTKWTNRTRTLVLASRTITSRGRHLMKDFRQLLPHSKKENKFNHKVKLFEVNEMAEAKNCQKVMLFEGRAHKDLFLWLANVHVGPSVWFEVMNIHTTNELKMTGNCLKGSRPLLSFDETFNSSPHWKIIKELFIQTMGVPNQHPKSQPFFDKVFTFAVVDNKVWFRNYQIIEETGALSEIGPRMVLDPIKIFEGSFTGKTIWEQEGYMTPRKKRSALKNPERYREKSERRAITKYSRPTGTGFTIDPLDQVFADIPSDEADEAEEAEEVEEAESAE
jgi:ribosome biogenesis protein BRX1